MHYSSEDLHKSRNESKDEEDDEDTDRLDVVGFDDSNISSPGKFMIVDFIRMIWKLPLNF